MAKNELIILVGTSGSGKTSLAKNVAQIENAPIISLSDLIREQAAKDGFVSLTAYFKKYGIKEGFAKLRQHSIDLIIDKLKFGKVIVEGMYDAQLFEEVIKIVGRDQIFLVSIAGTRHARVQRVALRSALSKKQAEKKIRKRDKAKWLMGLAEISKQANHKIRANTRQEAIANYKRIRHIRL
ncbi:MAG: AAA family ATPase [archaeon]|nr:AAA family ATPase [archaeon]